MPRFKKAAKNRETLILFESLWSYASRIEGFKLDIRDPDTGAHNLSSRQDNQQLTSDIRKLYYSVEFLKTGGTFEFPEVLHAGGVDGFKADGYPLYGPTGLFLPSALREALRSSWKHGYSKTLFKL